jgi:hypothetical protein
VDGGDTATCPRCGIDSVLGSAFGFPLTPDFLATVQRRWFGPALRFGGWPAAPKPEKGRGGG